eukprot:scaffold131875_cov24-Tisochrysis_lutea.AAC.1
MPRTLRLASNSDCRRNTLSGIVTSVLTGGLSSSESHDSRLIGPEPLRVGLECPIEGGPIAAPIWRGITDDSGAGTVAAPSLHIIVPRGVAPTDKGSRGAAQ